ncbi:MAG: rRNA maturation RNase YbeY [Chitinophagales bacterium]
MNEAIEIYFHIEEPLKYEIKQKKLIKKVLLETIIAENYELESLNFILCTDEYLHKMNVQYLQHDTLTDVITFDNSETEEEITGDIFISIERVVENATIFETTTEKELHRVILHGTLHLLGYKDKSENEQQMMRQKENFYLRLFKKIV